MKEEKNILKKVINFIKRIFFKQQEPSLKSIEPSKKDNIFIKKIEDDRKLLNMQKSFESGELKETDLTEEEKEELMKLYNEQIKDLKQEIENYNKVLNSYKEKILIAKSKLDSQ